MDMMWYLKEKYYYRQKVQKQLQMKKKDARLRIPGYVISLGIFNGQCSPK